MAVDEEERKRVNPFDWQRAFPQVFAQGGFDAVVGNPPYIRTLSLEHDKKYFNQKYRSAYGAYDIYVLFMEKSIELIKKIGLIGFITPNKYFVADYGKGIRAEIIKNAGIVKIADFGKCKSLFDGAFISTAITILTKEKSGPDIGLVILDDDTKKNISEIKELTIPLSQILTKQNEIRVYSEDKSNLILAKLENNSLPLIIVAQVRTGVMGFDYWQMEKYISDDFSGIRIATNSYIDKYQFLWGKKVRLYKKEYYEPRLNPSCDFLSENTIEFFKTSKVVVRGVAQRLTAMLDEEGTGLLVAVHGVIGKNYSNKFLLGLINSKLLNWIHIIQFYSARIPEGSLRYPISFLSSLPIPNVDLSKSADLAKYNHMITLVERMLDLHKRSPATPQEQERLARDIAATDRAIDALVYQLYDLTPEEIAIVEAA